MKKIILFMSIFAIGIGAVSAQESKKNKNRNKQEVETIDSLEHYKQQVLGEITEIKSEIVKAKEEIAFLADESEKTKERVSDLELDMKLAKSKASIENLPDRRFFKNGDVDITQPYYLYMDDVVTKNPKIAATVVSHEKESAKYWRGKNKAPVVTAEYKYVSGKNIHQVTVSYCKPDEDFYKFVVLTDGVLMKHLSTDDGPYRVEVMLNKVIVYNTNSGKIAGLVEIK